LVTKALILTNYIFSGMVETLNEAIGVYYDVFVKYKDLTPQLKEDEIQDFNTFFSSVWNGKYELDDANRKIFNEFYTNYTNINKEL
jgi:hypothetical protein